MARLIQSSAPESADGPGTNASAKVCTECGRSPDDIVRRPMRGFVAAPILSFRAWPRWVAPGVTVLLMGVIVIAAVRSTESIRGWINRPLATIDVGYSTNELLASEAGSPSRVALGRAAEDWTRRVDRTLHDSATLRLRLGRGFAAGEVVRHRRGWPFAWTSEYVYRSRDADGAAVALTTNPKINPARLWRELPTVGLPVGPAPRWRWEDGRIVRTDAPEDTGGQLGQRTIAPVLLLGWMAGGVLVLIAAHRLAARHSRRSSRRRALGVATLAVMALLITAAMWPTTSMVRYDVMAPAEFTARFQTPTGQPFPNRSERPPRVLLSLDLLDVARLRSEGPDALAEAIIDQFASRLPDPVTGVSPDPARGPSGLIDRDAPLFLEVRQVMWPRGERRTIGRVLQLATVDDLEWQIPMERASWSVPAGVTTWVQDGHLVRHRADGSPETRRVRISLGAVVALLLGLGLLWYVVQAIGDVVVRRVMRRRRAAGRCPHCAYG